MIARLRWLTPGGTGAALAVGAAVYAGLGGEGLWLLVAFFVTSSALTTACRYRRRGATLNGAGSPRIEDSDPGGRTAAQVLANGGVAAVGALLAMTGVLPGGGFVAVGALSAATADTWATEVGMRFGSRPWRLRTGTRAVPGEPGAVSVPGTLAGISGSVFIGLLAVVLFGRQAPVPWLPVGVAAGILGMWSDTLAGTFIEPGISSIGNNAVNLIGTIIGGATGWLVGSVLSGAMP